MDQTLKGLHNQTKLQLLGTQIRNQQLIYREASLRQQVESNQL